MQDWESGRVAFDARRGLLQSPYLRSVPVDVNTVTGRSEPQLAVDAFRPCLFRSSRSNWLYDAPTLLERNAEDDSTLKHLAAFSVHERQRQGSGFYPVVLEQ